MIGDSMTDHDAAVENQVPFLLRENEENREHFAFLTDQKCSTSCIGFVDCSQHSKYRSNSY